MESLEAYFDRKHDELKLLTQCLRTPLPVSRPRSVNEVIQCKFQLAAALKAQHALNDWAITETAWSGEGGGCSGPFELEYDYQRADLEVHGPSFYALGADITGDVIYTASGMAAISALLMALIQLVNEADILMMPDSYGETQELVERYARHLRMVPVQHWPIDAGRGVGSPRILLLDSGAPADGFRAVVGSKCPPLDLLVFDTTCFSGGSGRIRRVLKWASEADVPVVMVRSHTKLDSLGAEYGRLGSVVFVSKAGGVRLRSCLKQLPAEVRNAVRLFGGAAMPAHFPPYIGSPEYRKLTSRRLAAILRNCRRSARHFRSSLPGLVQELRFAHDLYVTLASRKLVDEAAARRAAARISHDLGRSGLPIRHAGSFGFDFAATEWFRHPATGEYSVRLAIPDLPTALWDELVKAIAQWWSAHHGTGAA